MLACVDTHVHVLLTEAQVHFVRLLELFTAKPHTHIPVNVQRASFDLNVFLQGQLPTKETFQSSL